MSEIWENPWSFPVPVKKSDFTALFPEHRAYNVQVHTAAAERMGSRGKTIGIDRERLLYSDLQTNSDITAFGHLGSGRSGFYRGKYLKGVGRTPLLMAWNSTTDPEHTSGRMTVAGAAHEWAVSCFLSAKGHRSSIVPCEGVLVSSGRVPHAISLKAGGFARMSNFVWMLNHYSDHCSIQEFLALLAEYSGGPVRSRRNGADIHPRDAIEALDQAFWRGKNNFEIYFRYGVVWHAVRNNFTLDGRFLDLETATCLGAPFIGILEVGTGHSRDHQVIGLELLSYAVQFRRFVLFLRSRISFLAEQADILRPREKLVAREVLFQLDRIFGRDHLLNRGEKIQREAFSMVTSNLEIPGRSRSELLDFIRHKFFHPRLRITDKPKADLAEFRFPILSEPSNTRFRIRSLRCLKLKRSAFQEGEHLTETMIHRLTSPRDVDTLLSRFREMQSELIPIK